MFTLGKEWQELCLLIWEGPEKERVEALLIPFLLFCILCFGLDKDLEVF